MKVLKFGGTSVGTPGSLMSVKEIALSQSEDCVIVVSALGGLTDCLISTAEMASAGNAAYLDSHAAICRRHHDVCAAVLDAGQAGPTLKEVDALLDELQTIFRAIFLLGELTERSKDLVVSYGERMSSRIVAAMIQGAVLADSLDFIRTRRNYGKSVLDQGATSELIAAKFGALKGRRTVIVPGFIARDEANRISNLGRGGSDYTAAIIAAELGAGVLEIWTDVDGFMSADPRVVKDARIIDRLSFVEAMELCNFGAKVVYPPTIYPVFHRNIPILIKNTFNPSAAGTLITEEHAGGDCRQTLGVSAIADTRLISLEGGSPAIYERMINALTRIGVETFLPDGKNCCAMRAADAPRAEKALREEFAQELVNGEVSGVAVSDRLATLAVVGRGGIDDAPGRLAAALNCRGIPVAHGPQQASPDTVACMVDGDNLAEALKIIHSVFINNEQ